VIVRAARDTAFKLERLHALARKSPVAIVVDDLDLMLPKDRSLLLVNLCQLPNTKLVCLTQTRETYVHLDPRVQSRIQPRFIRFSEYPIRDLVRILHARAEQSLADGSWSHADLVAIVDASRGDARVAIQALHAAACSAEKHWSPQLRSKDIHDGLAAASPLHRRYLLNMLSDHHRLIYSIIKRAGEIPLPHAWGAYQKLAREQGMPPMSRRTFNEYRQYMVTIKLLAEQQATGRGNVLLLRVVQ
jgi:Cdc6-like AAA superfamily ATPase